MLKLFNFDKILSQASDHIMSLPESHRQSLKENLDHGKALLQNNDELKAYIHFYGDIHRQKLLMAFSKLPKNLKDCQISVIDWGCGQGIACLVLIDYIDKSPSRNIFISDITLVEPSVKALKQAESYINWTIPKTMTSTIQKKEEEIQPEDILTQESIVVHLLSNIVDMPEFSGDGIIGYIESNKRIRHIVICVSPFYPEEGRGKRMEDFGNRLSGFKCIHSFERHIEDWDKDFSCQIRIYDNA